MVSSQHKRRAIEHLVTLGKCSVRRACQVIGLSRSSYHRKLKEFSEKETLLLKRLIELSLINPSYGYRFIHTLMCREGWRINHKKVQRLRRKEGLCCRAHQPKNKIKRSNAGAKKRAQAVNDVWCWDFVHDVSEDGRSIRILSVVDEYSRYCIELKAQRSFGAQDVLACMEKAINRYGTPKQIRSDNGPEFIAKAIENWLKKNEINSLYIQPGSPWQNPFVESFHSRLRSDCLNREWFINLLDAQARLSEHKEKYNCERPHSGIKYKSPIEVYEVSDCVQATPSLNQRLAITHMAIPMLT